MHTRLRKQSKILDGKLIARRGCSEIMKLNLSASTCPVDLASDHFRNLSYQSQLSQGRNYSPLENEESD